MPVFSFKSARELCAKYAIPNVSDPMIKSLMKFVRWLSWANLVFPFKLQGLARSKYFFR
jgi:hypothetical protein